MLFSPSESGEPAKVIRLELRDNGRGYPDVTAGDGIYSGYLTRLSAAQSRFLAVEVTAINGGGARIPVPSSAAGRGGEATEVPRCCGQSMRYPNTLPCSSFVRHVSGGSTFVPGGENGGAKLDLSPPARILDFRLVDNVIDGVARFEWTATGDDFDLGAAERYEVRCYSGHSVQQEQQLDKDGIRVEAAEGALLPMPARYGATQRVNLTVPWPNEVFFYAIIAVDDVSSFQTGIER